MTSLLRFSLVSLAATSCALGAVACKSNASSPAPEAASSSPLRLEADKRPRMRLLPGLKEQRPKPMPLASALPIPAASVDQAVNPRNLPAYSGPTGVVEGVVRFKGEKPQNVALQLPDACSGAAAMYGSSFREGPGRTAADVLVAVTDYDAYVPAPGPNVRVSVNNCAYDRRTIAMTFGQRLEVLNDDSKNSYVPMLIGDTAPAHMVAVPHGDPIKLYPERVGHYLLEDEMNRPWMKADVYVVKYATFAVTGMDGVFRIEGIPVGKVKVTADVPWIVPGIEHTVEATVEAGKTTKLDFTLDVQKSPAPAGSASAAPSSSVK